MTIFLPDPDIGRCKNHRFDRCSCGHSEGLRCLDYEGTKHTCTFPAATHHCSNRLGEWRSYTITTPPPPKPWVKPDADE